MSDVEQVKRLRIALPSAVDEIRIFGSEDGPYESSGWRASGFSSLRNHGLARAVVPDFELFGHGVRRSSHTR
jgi:hypothetical protein